MAWLTAAEALAALNVQPQTLYASVSRGRIRAKPDPKDPRRSLYDGGDVKRLASRQSGRRAAAAVAAEAIGWGDPVLPSSVSTVADGRLFYRGQDAAKLATTASLEQVAALLWEAGEIAFVGSKRDVAHAAAPLEAALVILAKRAASDPPSRGRSRATLVAEASELLGDIADAMLGRSQDGALLHLRMAAAWSAPRAEQAIRRAFVLLADHELNASTFAARVTISTGAPLAAGLLAGLATLTGPLHGGVLNSVAALASAARRIGAAEATRDWLAQGRPLPAFGHPLYPDGDPRAKALLEHFAPSETYLALRAAADTLIGEPPNVDFATAALADAFDLPATAPFAIFAMARSVGWIAHALEQATSGDLIRPRARYVGPALRKD